MAYIGNTADQQAFTPAVDFFSGNGSTVAFTLSRPVASVAQVQATIENVPQNPGTAFTVSGNTITFDGAPASGTNNIYVYYTSPITQVIQPGQGTVGLTQFTASGTPSSSTFLRGDNSWQVVSVTPTAVSDQLNASTGYFDLPTGTTAQRPGSPIFGMIRANSTTGFPEWYSSDASAWVQFNQGLPYSVDYLVVAGGGAGGSLGGGGAGGYLSNSSTLSSGTTYAVVVGAGGASITDGSINGPNGNNSSLGAIATAIAGGGGARAADNRVGSAGGSGGGGGADASAGAGGAGTAGQGNNGGTAGADGSGNRFSGGGGGGAGAVGANGPSATFGGNGGAGLNWQSLGTNYAGGGGGGAYSFGGTGTAGTGGAGGGGNGGRNGLNATSATANTGGGGGGMGYTSSGNLQGPSGGGGSGIVIIRYSGSQRGSGGTVTSAGGFTYHTFTSSGTYTA